MGLNPVARARRGRSIRLRVWVGTCALGVLAGCAGVGLRGSDIPSMGIRASWAIAGIRDERAAFASAFCAHFDLEAPGTPPCETWSWPKPITGVARSTPGAPRTVVVVPGIFGECVAEWVTPFSDAYDAWRAAGHTVLVADVTGRGSSALNAARINDFMAGHDAELRNVVVIAYSKGFSDFMLAATSPRADAWRDRVDGVVSVAGTANGSPLANRWRGIYERLLKDVPMDACAPEDRGGVTSLTYAEAMAIRDGFLALPDPIPVYAIAAVSERAGVNPVLGPFHTALAGIDDRNDGQVRLEDTLLPGATLLGIYRADHWSIALPFERSDAKEVFLLSRNNHFPRRALAAALVDYVPARIR